MDYYCIKVIGSAREISSQILSDKEADNLIMKLFNCITIDSRNRKVVNDVLKDITIIERMIARSKSVNFQFHFKYLKKNKHKLF